MGEGLENRIQKETYTESLFYQIRLTAKYLKLLGVQLFEGLNIEIPFEEYIALDIINNNEALCQRDLAKLLIKDRANTGRIINRLSDAGYVEVKIDKRSNRIVKMLFLTKMGKKFVAETNKRILPYTKHIKDNIDVSYEDKLVQMLKDLRNKLSELVETQI